MGQPIYILAQKCAFSLLNAKNIERYQMTQPVFCQLWCVILSLSVSDLASPMRCVQLYLLLKLNWIVQFYVHFLLIVYPLVQLKVKFVNRKKRADSVCPFDMILCCLCLLPFVMIRMFGIIKTLVAGDFSMVRATVWRHSYKAFIW